MDGQQAKSFTEVVTTLVMAFTPAVIGIYTNRIAKDAHRRDILKIDYRGVFGHYPPDHLSNQELEDALYMQKYRSLPRHSRGL